MKLIKKALTKGKNNGKVLKRGTKMNESVRVTDDDRVIALAQFLELSPEEVSDITISKYSDASFEYGNQEYSVYTEDEADDAFNEQQAQLLDDIGIDSFTKSFQQWITSNAIDEKSFWKDFGSDIENMIEEEPSSYTNYFDIKEIKKDLIKMLDSEKKRGFSEIKKYIKSAIEENDMSYLSYQTGVLGDYISTTYSDFTEYLEDEIGQEDADEKAIEKAFDDWYKTMEEDIDNADDEEIVNQMSSSGNISDYTSDALDEYVKNYDSPMDYLSEMGYEGESLNKILMPYLDVDAIYEEVKSEDGRGPTLSSYDGEENEITVDKVYFYIYRTN